MTHALLDVGVETMDALAFNDHCLVFGYDRLVFDPVAGLTPPAGHRPCPYGIDDVMYSLTISERKGCPDNG